MATVFNIGISKNFKGKMESVPSIEAIAGKGLVNDRYFKSDNKNLNQITLIEKEKIDYFNKLIKSSIPYIDFRRNIITEGIELNGLVGRKIAIGEITILIHDLCQPCKNLQESLNQKNLVKQLLNKSGLRCEILTSGKINVGDEIKN